MVETVEEMNSIEESFSYEYDDKFIIEDNLDRRIYLNTEINDSTVDIIVYQIISSNMTFFIRKVCFYECFCYFL